MDSFQERINSARQSLLEADSILIGGGAGLSAAAGLSYSGKWFNDHFADFIEKYGITDLYSASFYPFETQEEFWAQWARHIDLIRFTQGPTTLYQNLLKLVQSKPYFVITTNVESQFEKAGFPGDKIFEVQGNYAYMQCAKACTPKLYEDEPLIREMQAETRDCRIPSRLVPKCPVCGGPMDVNLRHNEYFVQDDAWFAGQKRYEQFIKNADQGRIVFLELGVGFNTPGIIRYPFESMTYRNPNAALIRINRDYPLSERGNIRRLISFDEDMTQTIHGMM